MQAEAVSFYTNDCGIIFHCGTIFSMSQPCQVGASAMLLSILEAKKYEVLAASTVITFVLNFVSNYLASEVQSGAPAQHEVINLLISLKNESRLIKMLTTLLEYIMFIFTGFDIYRQAHFTCSL